MALFTGGPYNGRELDVDPAIAKTIRLPAVEEWDVEQDPDATVPRKCPFVYAWDDKADPPCYRFVQKEA